MLMVAFHEAFPHVYAWDIEGATALIGSATELALDPEAMRESLANPTLQKDLRPAKFSTLESLLNHFLHKDEAFARFASPALAVTDNHPYVEFFAVPKKRYGAYQYDLLAALYQEKPDPLALLKQPAGPALVKSLERDALELRRHRRLMLQSVAERPGVLAEIEGMFAVQAVADTRLRVKQHAGDWVEGGTAISGGVYEVIGESEYYYHVTGLGVAELTSAWIEKAKVRAEGTVRSPRSSAPNAVKVVEDASLLIQPGETRWVDAASVKRGDVVDVLSENDEYYLVRLRGDVKLRTGWLTKRSVEVVSGDDISP
jgi:hypothetical protein